MPEKIYKDSLAFRLLRMYGYTVTPSTILRTLNTNLLWNVIFTNIYIFLCTGSFCWFLCHEDIVIRIERNFESFTSAMYNVYRATDLIFQGEYELEKARLFSRKLLEKSMTLKSVNDNLVIFPNLRRVVRYI